MSEPNLWKALPLETMNTDATPLCCAIYVDALMPCMPTKRWKWDRACHLFSDPGPLDALHHFAQQIGLRRSWFQCLPGKLPHYDLSPYMRLLAVEFGAHELDRDSTVARIRSWRAFDARRVISHNVTAKL